MCNKLSSVEDQLRGTFDLVGANNTIYKSTNISYSILKNLNIAKLSEILYLSPMELDSEHVDIMIVLFLWRFNNLLNEHIILFLNSLRSRARTRSLRVQPGRTESLVGEHVAFLYGTCSIRSAALRFFLFP